MNYALTFDMLGTDDFLTASVLIRGNCAVRKAIKTGTERHVGTSKAIS